MRWGRAKSSEAKPPAAVLPALITPRRPGTTEVDLGALFELLDFVAAAGIGGIALFGSTGEFTHYTLDERARVAGLCVKRSRVPVIVNVSHSSFEGALALTEAAASAGAAGVLAMPPHYFRYAADEVEAFYLALGGAAAKWVPLYLYNIPQFASPIPPHTAARLLKTGMFAGIKDSSGDWDGFTQLAAAHAEKPFELYVGHDRIFADARKAGATGVVSGIASAVPELVVALDRAIMAGKDEHARRLNSRLQDFIQRIEHLPAPVGIREAASLRNMKAGPHALRWASRD